MSPTPEELKRRGYAADALLRDEVVAAWLKDEPARLLASLMTAPRDRWDEIVADAKAIQRLQATLGNAKMAGSREVAKEKRNAG